MKFCDVDKFEKFEIDTDSRYLALAEKELENSKRPGKKAEWEQLRSRDCTNTFTADAVGIFFLRMCCDKHKKMTSESLVFSNRSSRGRKCCVFVVKLIAATKKEL